MTAPTDNEIAEAAMSGDLDLVRAYLVGGVAPDARNDAGQSAFALAAARNHHEIVQLFLDHGADPNGAGSDPSPARAACTMGALDSLRLLLTAGADPNAEHPDGQSLLTGLILAEGTTRNADYLELAGLLLAAGADIDASDADGATALTRAVILGRPETVRWLLAKGADAKLGGAQGLSLLEIAKARKQDAIAQLLLAAER